jgi:DNA invertase Pin-like site-specific DNA recombinase
VKAPPRRCALYTRKSSEEGLDQAFNSLDAQREAAEAYVKSQASEGWRALPTRYDDGGYSGGSMQRPALASLMADIAAGRIDVVVVYKIDRLTRSLADFARLVELFDRHNVSFVSVTQQFNTTSSMGRLTLNVLLSFAQFEREVTGERIRDKIAASKAKGMWMGGVPPLGYDLPVDNSRTLQLNEAEAGTVRTIFATYLELGSVHALEQWLAAEGIRSKQRTTRAGKVLGGLRLSRGALFHLLRNRIYRALIVHRDAAYPAAHPAVVDEATFAAVQAKLDAATSRKGPSSRPEGHLLTGRIVDCDGNPMSPTSSRGSGGRLYRYYVSAPLQQGRSMRVDTEAVRRVPAAALEAMLADIARHYARTGDKEPLKTLRRIEVHKASLQLLLPRNHLSTVRDRLKPSHDVSTDPGDPSCFRLIVPARMRLRGGRTWIEGSAEKPRRHDPVLIRALRSAHRLTATGADRLPVLESAPSTPYLRRIVRLAFLAPDLQTMILEGTQPAGLTLEQLTRRDIPCGWADQRAMFAAARAN